MVESYSINQIGQDDGLSVVELSCTVNSRFQTNVLVRCRREPTFEAVIRFRRVIGSAQEAYIDCPTCAREYVLREDGTWFSDRQLEFVLT